MKMLVLYRPDSEWSRSVEIFIHDFKARNRDVRLEVLDIDTREGSATASMYDMMQQPSIIIMRDDGSLISSWQGERLPLIDEVAAYARG